MVELYKLVHLALTPLLLPAPLLTGNQRHLVAGDPLYDSSAPLYGSSSMANPGQEGSVVPGRGQQLSFSQACSLIKSPYSCLVLDTCRRHITLSPVFLKRQRSGIEKQLRTELLRFSERNRRKRP
ncbi:DNA-directed RNA polymerase I subunit RPA43-like [Rhincodon typus]|uniref:DNA-directed RNA polymerase I subunit RPA43-like n=1 Tax=Rhincodon typus TaxID=259920 RepID=UPI00202DB967|nr:DNA-directed RNA polymerase I subunit RPA43-like [Rhincodon typus]